MKIKLDVRNEHYEEIKSVLDQIKKILLLHNGKQNPVTSAEIARKIGIVEDDTLAKTRALILGMC